MYTAHKLLLMVVCLLDPVKKNHAAANRHRIRQIQTKYKMKEREKCSRPLTALPPRADAYSHVPAKITPYITVRYAPFVVQS